MKHLVTLSAFLLFASSLPAQTNPILPPFPSAAEHPVWHVRYNGAVHVITVGADSTFCGNTWNRVISTDPQAEATTLGYYRLEGRKAFYRETASCTAPEFLLYDFDVEPGDTVQCAFNFIGNPEPVTMVVLGTIPFEILGNEYREIFLHGTIGEPPFLHPFTLRWAEVVGNFYHPFYPAICLEGNCEIVSRVLCLNTDEGVHYVGPSHPDVPCAYPLNLHRIYVNKHVEGGLQNGADWPNAFSDLQDAIAIADPGDTIWVAQGTYLPADSGDRERYFEMKPGVVMYGGFDATETAAAQRDWETHLTVLSGDIGTNGDSTDNSYHVLYTIGTDSTATLDGFMVAGGQAIHADSNYFGHYIGGGGLFVDANIIYPVAAPVISNCVFYRNTAKYGGGVQLKNGANPVIRNCTFRQNRSTLRGGGLYKEGTASLIKPFTMEDCLFEENYARSDGGAMALDYACENHKIVRCIFRNNYAKSDGGGIYYFSACPSGEINLKDCLFESNEGASGGAIEYIQEAATSLNTHYNMVVSGSAFRNNEARVAGGGAISSWLLSGPSFFLDVRDCTFENNASLHPGGALYYFIDVETPSSLVVRNSVFFNNTNVTGEGTGGAIMVSGFFDHNVNATLIANCLFAKNSGALRLTTGDGIINASLRNCTFYDNGRRPFTKYWSSDFNDTYFLSMRFENCIIWEPNKPINRLFTNGLDVVMNGYHFRNSLLSVPACNLPGGAEACAENNLFNLYPQFLDTLARDFRVAACSPAINAGAYAGLDTLGIFQDLAGTARIQEGLADMGAYERPAFAVQVSGVQPITCPGAANGAVFFETTGDAPWHFAWQNETDADTTTNGLGTGTYRFEVTDAAGCSDTLMVVIPAADTIQAVFEVQNASAAGVADGAIYLVSIEGGVPPYFVFWPGGGSGDTLAGLLPGTYAVTVMDGFGCSIEQMVDVSFTNGTEEVESRQPDFVLFPNPAQGNLSLSWRGQAPTDELHAHLVFYNALGEHVLRESLHMRAGEIGQIFDLSGLLSGIYFIEIEGVTGQENTFRWRAKIIKQ